MCALCGCGIEIANILYTCCRILEEYRKILDLAVKKDFRSCCHFNLCFPLELVHHLRFFSILHFALCCVCQITVSKSGFWDWPHHSPRKMALSSYVVVPALGAYYLFQQYTNATTVRTISCCRCESYGWLELRVGRL